MIWAVLPLVLTIGALVEAIRSHEEDIRHLPKEAWIIVILFVPLAGPIAWLCAGCRRTPAPSDRGRLNRVAGVEAPPSAEFLRQVRERAEEQRRRAREMGKWEGSGEGSS